MLGSYSSVLLGFLMFDKLAFKTLMDLSFLFGHVMGHTNLLEEIPF